MQIYIQVQKKCESYKIYNTALGERRVQNPIQHFVTSCLEACWVEEDRGAVCEQTKGFKWD